MSSDAVTPPSRCHLQLPQLAAPRAAAAAAAASTQRSPAVSPSLLRAAGSCRSPEMTSSVTEEPSEVVVDNEDRHQAIDDFEEKAFFALGRSARPRSWCIAVVMWPYPFRAFAIRYSVVIVMETHGNSAVPRPHELIASVPWPHRAVIERVRFAVLW